MSDSLGQFGETWARGYLARKGYRVLDRNIRYRVGEIDIVARDGDELVFVEVKCRRAGTYGTGVEAVTRAKYERLSRAIATYVQAHGLDGTSYRLDVIGLEVDNRGVVGSVSHLEGVEAPG